MIVEALYDVFFGFLDLVFSAFTLPGFSDGILQVFNTIKGYLKVGMEILLVFTQKDILYFCLGSVLFGIVAYEVVALVLWLLKKIPAFGTN